MPPGALKTALEDLLRARRLQADAPPLRGEERRSSILATGVVEIDTLLAGGLPRGQVSEVHGPASSGRTGFVLATAARTTLAGALAAWVDPSDRLDPASAAAAGVVLSRLLWLRGESGRPGRGLAEALSAVGVLVGAGLFDLVVLDVAAVSVAERQRLPNSSWIRLARAVEATATALVLVGSEHVAASPGGVMLAFRGARPIWSGTSGHGRLLRGLATEVHAGRHGLRSARLELQGTTLLGNGDPRRALPAPRAGGARQRPVIA